MAEVQMSTEEQSRQLAEDSREKDWTGKGFIKELFLGNFDLDAIHPFPVVEAERPEFTEWLGKLETFLREKVDSVEIDRTGEYPEEVVKGLAELGCFGMKIPTEYGGLGFSQIEYNTAMEVVGSFDGNITALLSAHQSIGCPQPLKLFGTPEQKKKYLPRLAAGAISAFALTEPHVGSDPASLSTTAEPQDDGSYVLNGEKLWCTNGTLAELLVVMARNTKTNKITAFIVDTSLEGVKVEYRCRFMGLKALANGIISFTNVRVSGDDVLGKDGKGLAIALTTLNTGRLTLPAAAAGIGKRCLEILRHWCNQRNQWGLPIGKHEAISHMIADMTSTTYAMDSISKLSSQMADRGGYDIRLEAAAAKEWNTVRAWEIIDNALQVRGGRGYETEASLKGRGETPTGIERIMRDSRINLIFEGSSEIMHLFMAREAVDKHLQVAGAMIDPKASVMDKIKAQPGMIAFYAKWYPQLWLRGLVTPFKYDDWDRLAPHLRFIDRSARRLARNSFHAMALYQAKMERKQVFLFRLVDIVMELFAQAASLSRAKQMLDSKHPDAERAVELAELFCKQSQRKVKKIFKDLWSNEDAELNAVAKRLLKGEHAWLEAGIFKSGLVEEDLKPRSFAEAFPNGKPESSEELKATA